VVGPARKREGVAHLEGVLEKSERRACEVIVQPRSTQRYRGRKRSKDAALVAELRRISAAHPRAGYRMASALLRRAGMEINAKRVQRLWRQEGLKVPRRQRQRQRLGNSEAGTQRLQAERGNQVWSYDFIFDQTEDRGGGGDKRGLVKGEPGGGSNGCRSAMSSAGSWWRWKSSGGWKART